MPIETIAWDKQDVVSCDERGRATLGTEFADEQVFVWIARTPDADELVEPSDAEKETLTNMASWASENVDKWFNLKAEEGVVVDKRGNEYETPYRYDRDADEMVTAE